MLGATCAVLAGAGFVVSGSTSSAASSGATSTGPLCSQAALQSALDAGGTYQLCGSTIQLTSELVMSAGHVTLEGGSLEGLLPRGAGEPGSRVFAVHGGSLTLVDVSQHAVLEAAAPTKAAGNGADGTDGAAGMSGEGPGAGGAKGKNATSAGSGRAADSLNLAPGDPEDAGGHVLRGGCLWIGSGASVYLDGGSLACQAGYGPEPVLNGGSGGDGGNGGAGGNGGSGSSQSPGAGGNGGDGGNGTNGGNGAPGSNGYDAEGGAIFNQGSLYMVGTSVSGSALGGEGGNGGDGGQGGNGGNGGAGGTGYPTDQNNGGNGGNGGMVGDGGSGGNGGNSGNAEGGGIYNSGEMTLAQADFNQNSVQTWPGGNMAIGSGCPQQGGCGGQHGGVQFGLGGYPNGQDGQYPNQVPVDGAGGNGGNAGDAVGGAVYSTTPFVDSDSTFENNAATCEGCGSAADYPTGDLNNGSPAGKLGGFGAAEDPDVHGSDICPAGGGARDVGGARTRSASVSGSCRLFTATVYDASDGYQALLDDTGHAGMIRIQFKSSQGKPIPSLKVSIPGVEVDWGWSLDADGAYVCDAPGGALDCQSASGGEVSDYILAYVQSSPLGKRATVSALGGSVSNTITRYPLSEGKKAEKHLAQYTAIQQYRGSISFGRQFMSFLGSLFGVSYGYSAVEADDAEAFRDAVIRSDPPDPRTAEVALPAPLRPLPAKPSCAKAKPRLRARCQRLARAVVAFDAADLELAAIDEATATAMNRFNTAQREGDEPDAGRQDYALLTLAAEADGATARLNAASRLLAGALAAIGWHDLSAQQVAQAARDLETADLPEPVMSQLAAWRISRQEFTKLMKPPAGFRATKLDPVAVLRTPLARASAGRYDIGGVAALIEGLHAAGSINSAQYAALVSDVKRYVNSPDAATLAAITRDCASLPGAAGEFMSFAASFL